MHYEINVTLGGKHLFGTHERSLTDSYSTLCLLGIFETKFPESEGYEISVSKHEDSSVKYNIKEFREQHFRFP